MVKVVDHGALFPRAPSKRRRVLLALSYCGVLCAVLAYVLRSQGVAKAQALLGIGEAIPLDYLPVDTSELRVNGTRFYVHNAHTSRPVASVMDGFAELCTLDATRIRGVLNGNGTPKTPGETNPLVLRNDNEHEGMAGCFAPRIAGELGEKRGLGERIGAFIRSQRLEEIGDMRMVMARRGRTSTHVLHLWNEEGIPLKEMFPTTGDAPGADPVAGLAAAGFTRTVSVDEPSGSYRFATYTAKDLRAARAHADEVLERAGFSPQAVPKGLAVPEGMVGYSDGRELVVVGARVQAGVPTVAVMRLGSPEEGRHHE